MDSAKLRTTAFVYFAKYQQLPIFFKRFRGHWVDAVMGATATGIVFFLVAELSGITHYWLLLLFVGAFVPAAYLTWREEYLKIATERMTCRIRGITIAHRDDSHLVYISVRIINRGPNTAIHDWNGRFADASGANTHLTENIFLTPELGPDGRPDANLLHDERI